MFAPRDVRKALVSQARQLLNTIRSQHVPLPQEDSPAFAAYDPHITRKLHTTIPVKALKLPSQEDVWLSLDGLLDGWDEMVHLISCQSLLAWDVRAPSLYALLLCSSSSSFIRSFPASVQLVPHCLANVYLIWDPHIKYVPIFLLRPHHFIIECIFTVSLFWWTHCAWSTTLHLACRSILHWSYTHIYQSSQQSVRCKLEKHRVSTSIRNIPRRSI